MTGAACMSHGSPLLMRKAARGVVSFDIVLRICLYSLQRHYYGDSARKYILDERVLLNNINQH